MPPVAACLGECRLGDSGGSSSDLPSAGTRNGASASSVTTHGDTVVMKLLARKGPSGCASQRWMSRADQSLTRDRPNMCLLGFVERDRLAEGVTHADVAADLEFEIKLVGGQVAVVAARAPGLAVRPHAGHAAFDHRRGAAVICDRQVAEVRQHRHVRP